MKREVLSTVTSNEHLNMPYPHVELGIIDDAVTLVLSGLEQGDLPIIGEYEGRTYKVASVRKSAIILSRLLRVTSLIYHKTETMHTVLKTSDDILEVLSN